MHAV
jgi:hypothetical protein